MIEKIIVVTRETALQELSNQLGTRSQAKFYIEQEAKRQTKAFSSLSFDVYERADGQYHAAEEKLRAILPRETRVQWLDSKFLPQFTFGENDLVVVLGADGLVVNVAKYLSGQTILAVNPDPATIEGILLPFTVASFPKGLARAIQGNLPTRHLHMAQATLADGQTIYALNDIFIGQRTHASARYQIRVGESEENHSSSGIIVCTGTGSTGWMRSLVAGAAGLVNALGGEANTLATPDACRFEGTEPMLRFFVREPWVSKTTGANLVCGDLYEGDTLEIVSQMPQNGVLFSDGMESDFIPFNSGTVATIRLSDKTVCLGT
jgi:NAD kinase